MREHLDEIDSDLQGLHKISKKHPLSVCYFFDVVFSSTKTVIPGMSELRL